ncbi:MAG: mechanosensitive ion channel family protein, partial [Cyanobacteria bacterium J06648_11]
FTWLFTISTLGAVVLGFALQETLGNLFAGIGLQIDAPFKLGDWIQVDDYIGEVLSLSWRATVLRTVDREVVFIPNSAVGRTNLKNFSHENAFGNTIDFGLRYEVPPSQAIRVLRQAAQSVENVLQQPPVTVFAHHYADYAIVYRLLYWSRLPGQQRVIRSQIHQRVWYALQRAGLSVPFPIQDLFLHRPAPGDRESLAEHVQLLRKVDFLEACKLSEAELEYFLHMGRLLQFTQNERVCQVGDPGDAFYIIVAGQVQVLLDFPRRILAVLSAGQYFGEIALLTGQSRTATVMAIEDTEVLAFDRVAFQMVLDAHPLAAERIAAVIAERQQAQR